MAQKSLFLCKGLEGLLNINSRLIVFFSPYSKDEGRMFKFFSIRTEALTVMGGLYSHF